MGGAATRWPCAVDITVCEACFGGADRSETLVEGRPSTGRLLCVHAVSDMVLDHGRWVAGRIRMAVTRRLRAPCGGVADLVRFVPISSFGNRPRGARRNRGLERSSEPDDDVNPWVGLAPRHGRQPSLRNRLIERTRLQEASSGAFDSSSGPVLVILTC